MHDPPRGPTPTPAQTLPTPALKDTAIDEPPKLDFQRQTKYLLRCLKTFLPQPYTSNDSNRMSLAFFIIAGLDLLGQLKGNTTAEQRKEYVDWVYKNQHPNGGFRASPSMDLGERRNPENESWDPANLPSTYFALSLLLLLEDDLSRVKRTECLDWLAKVQRPDGSFGEALVDGAIHGGHDSRFGYCGAGVWYILGGSHHRHTSTGAGSSGIDIDKLVECIRIAESYDGGIADLAYHEAHAGFTFCGVGILSFLGRLPKDFDQHTTSTNASTQQLVGLRNPQATLRWLMYRQTATLTDEDDFDTNGDETDTPATCHDAHSLVDPKSKQLSAKGQTSIESRPSSHFELDRIGFNGRCNKIADTCYAFWVLGALSILGQADLPSHSSIRRWLLERTAHLALGGFGKHAGDLPDIYHTSLGLATLSIMGVEGMKPLDSTMCISIEAKDRLQGIWRRWGIDSGSDKS